MPASANPSTFGGPVSTPTMTRVAEQGLTLQPLPRHRALLADARRAAHGPQPSHGRLRLDRRAAGPVPRLHRERAEGLRLVRARAAGQRLLDRRVRQVAPDARPRPGRGGAVRPLAERLGLRPLLGLPRRRGGPVRPGDHAGQHDHRRPGGSGRASTTCRTTSPTRRCAGCTRCARRTRRSPGSCTTRPAARTRRTRWPSSGARSTAASSTRAGTGCARRRSSGRSSSA